MEDILSMAVNKQVTISIPSRGATTRDTKAATTRHIVSSILHLAFTSAYAHQKLFPNVVLFSIVF